METNFCYTHSSNSLDVYPSWIDKINGQRIYYCNTLFLGQFYAIKGPDANSGLSRSNS